MMLMMLSNVMAAKASAVSGVGNASSVRLRPPAPSQTPPYLASNIVSALLRVAGNRLRLGTRKHG